MNITIQIDDSYLQARAEAAVANHIGIKNDPYGRPSYDTGFARTIEQAMAEKIRDALKAIDFQPLIDAAVKQLAQPTVEEAIAAEIRIMAKREVKAALKERQG